MNNEQKFFASFFKKRRPCFPFCACLAVIATVALSSAVNTSAAAQSEPPQQHSPADFERMAVDLAAELARRPDDVDNWILLGRTYVALQRWPDAKDAFAHATALHPEIAALHAQMGEILTLQEGGTVTPAAHEEFTRAPDDPRSLFYLAVERAQRGDTHGAIERLQALAAEAPKQASWRQIVLDELHALGAGAPAETAPPDSAMDEVEDELARLGAPDAPPRTAAAGVR